MCGRVKGHHSGAAVNTVTSQQNNFRVWLRAFLRGVCVPSLCPYRLIDHNLECEWEGFVLSHFWKIVCKFKVRFSEQQFFCVCVSIFKAHSVKFRVDSTHSPLCKNMLTVQLCFAAALTTVSAENSCEIRLRSSVSLLKKWRHLQYKHCPVMSEVNLILTVTNLIILIQCLWTQTLKFFCKMNSRVIFLILVQRSSRDYFL